MQSMRWGEQPVDPKNEAAAKKQERESLNGIREEIGEDRYKEIIGKLVDGDIENLSEDEKDLIDRIKTERRGTKH